MPKRTNEFQQLIYLIQKQLADDAIVTESKLFFEKSTEQEREVDIVVESTIGDIPLIIGFECTSGNRPSTVEWVERIIGKHANLSINKTVLVSKSGFTKSAKKKARDYQIETITLNEAVNLDWHSKIKKFCDTTLVGIYFEGKSWKVFHEVEKPGQPLVNFKPESKIYVDKKNVFFTVMDCMKFVMKNKSISLGILKDWSKIPEKKRQDEFQFTVNVVLPKDTQIEDELGNPHPLCYIEITGTANSMQPPLNLETGRFMDTNLAYGISENVFTKDKKPQGKLIVTVLEKEGEACDLNLMFPSYQKDGEPLIITLNQFLGKNEGDNNK